MAHDVGDGLLHDAEGHGALGLRERVRVGQVELHLDAAPFQALHQRAGGGGEAELLERDGVEVGDRAAQRPDGLARRRRRPVDVRGGGGRLQVEVVGQRVEHQPHAHQLLHRPVVQALGHSAALLLLRQDDGRGEGPAGLLLAAEVREQPGVGQRHRGLVGQAAQALDVVVVEGRSP